MTTEIKKHNMRYATVLALLVLSNVSFGEITLRSEVAQSTLVELYTSEGCSSCPPADRWLSSLKDHPALWRGLVPIAFHVDYWDYIGWKDRYARAAFTDRQRRYAMENTLPTIYTPGLISNGEEWRNFGWEEPVLAAADAGPLTLSVSDSELAVSFQPTRFSAATTMVANIVLLGFGLTSDVDAGENAGLEMSHDFVVLEHAQVSMTADGNSFVATARRPRSKADAERYAIALWVSTKNGQAPLQAVGGWLDE